jgi:hypothetical protein
MLRISIAKLFATQSIGLMGANRDFERADIAQGADNDVKMSTCQLRLTVP